MLQCLSVNAGYFTQGCCGVPKSTEAILMEEGSHWMNSSNRRGETQKDKAPQLERCFSIQ